MKNGGNRKKVIHEMFIFLTVVVFNLHCFICCCYEREVQVFTCKTVSLKALFIEQLVIAELSRAKCMKRSTKGKKMWLPKHPGNFGTQVTIRPPTRPSAPQEYRCKITQSTQT